MEKENIISQYYENIPLKTRIQVANEISFINIIHELGYREDKVWTKDDEDILNKILELAAKHTENILKEIRDNEID